MALWRLRTSSARTGGIADRLHARLPEGFEAHLFVHALRKARLVPRVTVYESHWRSGCHDTYRVGYSMFGMAFGTYFDTIAAIDQITLVT